MKIIKIDGKYTISDLTKEEFGNIISALNDNIFKNSDTLKKISSCPNSEYKTITEQE